MNFDLAFDRLIGHEGGYVNNPQDPGGETNWGISKRSYPDVDIKMLTREEAKAIYLRDFWQHIHGDKLHPGVAYQLFDFAVNSGVSVAICHLQRVLGEVDDGQWGPKSQAAADAMSEARTIMLLNADRLTFMTRLVNWPNASRGWARRIAVNLRYGAEDA